MENFKTDRKILRFVFQSTYERERENFKEKLNEDDN